MENAFQANIEEILTVKLQSGNGTCVGFSMATLSTGDVTRTATVRTFHLSFSCWLHKQNNHTCSPNRFVIGFDHCNGWTNWVISCGHCSMLMSYVTWDNRARASMLMMVDRRNSQGRLSCETNSAARRGQEDNKLAQTRSMGRQTTVGGRLKRGRPDEDELRTSWRKRLGKQQHTTWLRKNGRGWPKQRFKW